MCKERKYKQIAEVLILPSAIGKVAGVFVYEERRTTTVYHRNSPSDYISIISKETKLPIQWMKQKANQSKAKQKKSIPEHLPIEEKWSCGAKSLNRKFPSTQNKSRQHLPH